MTLILALGSPQWIIQLSDRQLTAVGGPIASTENKATLLTCRDARLLVGFTGIARAGHFRTAEWLLEALAEAAPPDDLAEGIVKRFVDVASKRFRTSPISGIAPADRRLSVMFTGYGYSADPPLQIGALVSNYQDFASRRDEPQPWDEFRPFFLWERRPPVDEPVATYIQLVGAWAALRPEDLEPLRGMLQDGRPPVAVVGKAVEIMREAADRRASGGTVGKELTSAVLRPEPSVPPAVDYHVTGQVHEIPMINQAVLLGEAQGRVLMRDAVLAVQNPSSTPPIRVQKVGRNAPCPCGSGKKYKHCHGA